MTGAEPLGRPAGPVGPGLPRECFLGIETSGPPGSVAVAADGVVVGVRFLGDQASHAARMIPAIGDVLKIAGRRRRDLDGVAVGAGPGSFTGVRVGAAAAKALARALDVPLYATSSLRAAAFAEESMAGVAVSGMLRPRALPAPSDWREIRYVLVDARGGRVYGACYDVGAEGPTEVVAPHGGTIVDVINGRPPVGTVFSGSGAAAHKRLLEAAGYVVAPAPAGVPGAAAVLLCCRWASVDVAAWEPSYVREWKPR